MNAAHKLLLEMPLLQKRVAGSLYRVIFLLFIIFQTRATPLFPQEDDTEDITEDVDDVYDEEETGTTAAHENVEEELDSGEKEDAAVRELLSQRLGITNFSTAALAQKASHFFVQYLVGITPTDPPKTRPRPRVRAQPTTPAAKKKYSIRKTTETPAESTSMSTGNATNQIRSFVINVPKGENGTGGGTIQINLPMPLTMKSTSEMEMPDHHSASMSISSDEYGLKNIEAAIMEALLIAQQMSSMTMSVSGDNETEIVEVDVNDVHLPPELLTMEATTTGETTNVTGVDLLPSLTSSPPSFVQDRVVQETSENSTTEASPSQVKPTKKRRIRSTTTPRGPTPDDPFAVIPATDVIVSQIRSGQLPQFLWKSVMKLASSKYAQIAVDAVECAVFYYCPDDSELGTLTKGAKF